VVTLNADRTVTATFTRVNPPSTCMLCVLSGSAKRALDVEGNATATVSGGVVVNSSNSQAARVAGNAELNATGSISGPSAPSGFQTTGRAKYSSAPVFAPAIEDPLLTLAQCPDAGIPCALSAGANVTLSNNQTATIEPGIYDTIRVTGGRLTLRPGVYVITGSLSIAGKGVVSGAGVTLFFACSSYPAPCAPQQKGAAFDVSGNGKLDLSPPSLGAFSGISVMYDRGNTAASSVSGNGSVVCGTVYMPAGALSFTGNSTVRSSRIIVGTAQLGGNSTLTIS
jgi:hypothetical protein